MTGSHNNFNDEKKDDVSTDKVGLAASTPLIKVRKRTGSSGGKDSFTLPQNVPNLKKSKKEKEDEGLSPKKASPRSPRKESSGSSKGSSPRFHAMWSSSGRASPRSPSSSPRFDYKYNSLPVSEEIVNKCINRANLFIAKQSKVSFEEMFFPPFAQGAGGAYMEAEDNENKFAVIITRAAEKSGWKYYLIEKAHLLADEKKNKAQESDSEKLSSFIDKGNEGRVVLAWDLQPSEIDGVVIREKVAAKIHHLKSTEQAALNEQTILSKLDELYGRFDYFYDISGEQIKWLREGTIIKATKRIIFMKFHSGINLMKELYVLDTTKSETDKARYLGKRDHSPLHRVRIDGAFLRAAYILQTKGVTHRDLKPNNALWDENGKVHFIDYSSAMITARIKGTESGAGTFPFVAPECDKLNNKQVKNFTVIDNYSVAFSLMEGLTRELFRVRILEKDTPDRAFELKNSEFVDVAPDLFYADPLVNFEDRLQNFIKQDNLDLNDHTVDWLLQDLIFMSYGRVKLIKIIHSLRMINPDDRMLLEVAVRKWEEVERELILTYEAFCGIIKGKAYLKSKALPADLINIATDKLTEMNGTERGRLKRRSYQQLKFSNSSSDSEQKSGSSSSPSPEGFPPPNPFNNNRY